MSTQSNFIPFAWRFIALSAILFLCAARYVSAQTTWTGSVGTGWNTAGNWSAGVPDASDDVTIPDVTNDPVISATGAVARSVMVQTGGLLTLTTVGTLTINGSVADALVNQGTVQNNGTITIGNLSALGGYGINNAATFSIATGAKINVDGIPIGKTALFNTATGVFTNAGAITIGANSNAGSYGIQNFKTFKNNAGSQINIDRTATCAIHNTSTFENTGAIRIGANAGAGVIGIRNEENFFNNAGGEINIDRVTTYGIENSGAPWGVDNVGIIKIGSLPGGNTFTTGVYNSGTFRVIGGKLTIDRVTDGMNLQSSATTENYAQVIIGELAGVDYLLKGLGGFKNNTNGVLKGSGRVSSTAIQTAGGHLSPGYSGAGIMRFVGPRTALMNGTFIMDVNGTGVAGVNYDQMVIEGDLGSISSWLSVTINYTPAIGDRVTLVQGTGGFGEIEGELRGDPALPQGWALEYALNKIDLVYDGIPASTTWTGAVSSDWSTAANWSAGVPGAITSVTIPNVANDPVISTATATSKSINVYPGGMLTVSNTGRLTINGASSKGFFNQGTTQNNGTLTIGNVSSVGTNGLYNSGTFNNNVGATINIDRATGTALYNAYGTFTNVGTIAIGANAAAGADGLDNDAIFNNNAGGQIRIDRVTSAGIYNNGTNFANAGSISMGSLVGGNTINWGIYSDKPFNNIGGHINIDRVNSALAANASTLNNTGSITIGAIAPVVTLLSNTGSGTFINNTGGILKGTGSIDAARFVNAGGSLAPGYSPGKMTFTSDETFSNSTLLIEVNGTGVAGIDYDQVAVNGTVTIGGNLVISTINGFSMLPGQTFNFITSTAVTGTFASVTWPAGVTGTVTYLSNAVTLNVLSVLPLTLIEFTGDAKGGRTALQWKTADEEHTSHFEIERSTNGVNYSKIGTVAAAGHGANGYSTTDESPVAGDNYYRLKMADLDGKFTYSHVVVVKFAAKTGLQVTPVPATGYITITTNNRSMIGQHAQVYSTAGSLVADVVLNGTTRLDISYWPSGIYIIKTKTDSYRFVKQ